VGAGPAGLYLVAALLKTEQFAQIDVYEAVPAPYGLVRYGVAPDHPKTRTISRVLARGFDDSTVRYFGNVTVGQDVTVDELRSSYDVVAIATGMLWAHQSWSPGTPAIQMLNPRHR
jgi:ferredoxin--NADP+ reductase